ncbi:hypothetical protein CF98_17155 [Halopseudomonas bauzanensis]|nr:hypothetical protein CF98_17155 [Halopseudomonas bauzanensis]
MGSLSCRIPQPALDLLHFLFVNINESHFSPTSGAKAYESPVTAADIKYMIFWLDWEIGKQLTVFKKPAAEVCVQDGNVIGSCDILTGHCGVWLLS